MKTSLRESGIRFGSNLTARSSGTHPTYLRLIRFRIAPVANISLLVLNAHGQPIKGFIWSKSNLSSAIVAIAIVSMTRYSLNLILLSLRLCLIDGYIGSLKLE